MMCKGGNIKQWNIGQGTTAEGNRDLGLEDLKGGKEGLVTVVAKEEQGWRFVLKGDVFIEGRVEGHSRRRVQSHVSEVPERGYWGVH